jgi:membrane fusion protein (multidrug efflux system)
MTVARQHRGAVAALSIFVLAACAACRTQTEEEVETTTVVTVTTAPAARGTIRGVVHATGIVSPAPGAELIVVAPEAARIAEIHYGSGERVRRGDVLVRFEIPSSAAEAQKQQAEVVRAEATLENAKATQTRARELFDRGVAARKEVEEANRAIADAEAAVAQARASLTSAQTLAERSTVRATFDGVIARRGHNPGDLVEPAASDPVLRVIDPDRLEVIASISLADTARVRVGASGHLMSAPTNLSDVELTVLSRPTAVEAGTATAPVRLRFGHPVNIPVGTPVQVDIEAEQHRDVIVIPAAAIVREGEETAAFVANAGKAARRPVRIGLADGTNVEILSGIDEGERVIVDGQAGLPDDAAITEEPKGAPEAPGDKDETK